MWDEKNENEHKRGRFWLIFKKSNKDLTEYLFLRRGLQACWSNAVNIFPLANGILLKKGKTFDDDLESLHAL